VPLPILSRKGFKIPFIAKLIAVVQFGVKAIFSEGKPNISESFSRTKMIYLDNSATTNPKPQAVKNAVIRAMNYYSFNDYMVTGL